MIITWNRNRSGWGVSEHGIAGVYSAVHLALNKINPNPKRGNTSFQMKVSFRPNKTAEINLLRQDTSFSYSSRYTYQDVNTGKEYQFCRSGLMRLFGRAPKYFSLTVIK